VSDDGIDEVKKNIAAIYERRRAACYALSLAYAADALDWFYDLQPARPNSQGAFWFNRTAQAALRMVADAFKRGENVGWLFGHGVDYGVYLELANDRQNEAIAPLIRHFAGQFFIDARELFID